MKNILNDIINYKRSEVEKRKSEVSTNELEKTALFQRPVFSLKKFLGIESKTGIIAEFKRRSPSKGIINDKADIMEVTKAYTDHGASGLSVLTDEHFFGGTNADLGKARANDIPLLRKDFIIDEYQVIESRSIGVDVILLIAACLTAKKVKELASFTKAIGLEVILEIHDEEEICHICDAVDIVGVNNRNLKTFEVNIERSLRMAEQIPGGKIKIAESGIDSIETIQLFKQHGFKGFLIGEKFMKEKDPGMAFKKFAEQLKQNPPLGGKSV